MKMRIFLLGLYFSIICCLETVIVTNFEVNYKYITTIHTILSTQWTSITSTGSLPDGITTSSYQSSPSSTNLASKLQQIIIVSDSADTDVTTTLTSTKTTFTTILTNPSDALDTHNEKRRLHQGTDDLVWSEDISLSAQQFADEYNCNGTLIHSHNPMYGENLAVGFKIKDAVRAWYDEIDIYNYKDPIFSEKTGHFTQIVWKNSRYVGCGTKYCDEYFGEYTVCQYWPPGNYKGEFKNNVLPLL